MRWGILICLLLLACTAPPKQLDNVEFAPTAAAVYTCTEEGCFDGPPEAYTYIPPKEVLRNLDEPNYSRDYNIKPQTPISCQVLGCENNMEAVGNRETLKWFPCECEAALDIPHQQVRCFRDFDEAMELGYERSTECDYNVQGGPAYFKGRKGNSGSN